MSYTLNISLQGISREVQLAGPVTIADLQAAVASTFQVDEDSLRFTYHDAEGDDVALAMDLELALAPGLCKGALDIKVSLADEQQQIGETQQHHSHDVRELYETAAAELRTSRGVPSMTAAKLRRTIALLQLDPRRLVAQGLAPRRLPVHEAAGPAMLNEIEDTIVDHGDDNCGDDTDEQKDVALATGAGEDPIHSAFVSRGVALKPQETGPLLAALGVGPRHLVGTGLVDRTVLCAYMLQSHDEAQEEACESTDVPDIHEVAAGALRASHIVASISAADLKETMALLELPSRRLTSQGLAPHHLLEGESAEVRREAGGDQATAPDPDGEVYEAVTAEDEGDGAIMGLVQSALVSRGVTSVSASEIRPLLRALGVRPERLVRLGLVERENNEMRPCGLSSDV